MVNNDKIELMFITNDPELACYVTDCGVNRVFVDLEIIGKQARQGHLDSIISNHSLSDIEAVRKAVPSATLLVRLNPIHVGSNQEIQQSLSAGADLLMLPMFSRAEEVRYVAEKLLGQSARLVPLVETPAALAMLPELLSLEAVSEIYLGLNDLHLGLGMDFMFEPLANGIVEGFGKQTRAAGLRFGFGGLARLDEGLLPGRYVLGEHVRLGSSSVILSRTFHGKSENLQQLRSRMDFKAEVAKLRLMESELRVRTPADEELDRRFVSSSVARITSDIRSRKRRA